MSSSMQTKKIEEALEHIKVAEKCLKTSLLKWRPDYDEAADEYNKAATCFRNAKSYEQSKEYFLKSADCHKQNRNGFYAAKSYDSAILACKELGDLRDVADLARRAARLFQTNGNAESASSTLDKAAKILEAQHPQEALELFQQAAEISIVQDHTRQAAEYMSKVARIHVKLKQFDSAVDAIRREMGLHQQNEAYQMMGRLTVALVLVQLARGDVVAAEKAFKEWGNCCEAPEVQNIERLLAAYDDEDPDAARRALGDPFIRHMDVEYAILAREIPLPEGGCTVPVKAGIIENATASYVSTKEQESEKPPAVANDEEDDEEETDLC